MLKAELLVVLAARNERVLELEAQLGIANARLAKAEDWFRSMKERGQATPDAPTTFVTDAKIYPLVDKLGRHYRLNGNVKSFQPTH